MGECLVLRKKREDGKHWKYDAVKWKHRRDVKEGELFSSGDVCRRTVLDGVERVSGFVIDKKEECDVCARARGGRGIGLVMEGEGNRDELLIEREGIEGELMVGGGGNYDVLMVKGRGSVGDGLEIERGRSDDR
jgi:hypothetical protein